MRPAYSAAFVDTKLTTFAPLEPIERITPQWAWGDSRGEGVKVAVLDSGIDATHPAVGEVQGYVAIHEGDDLKLVFETEPHGDSFGHGTACAGVIRSLAPACELYSVKVLGGKNTGKGRVFAAGLRWAIESGMHVCNLSLGTTKRDFFSIFHELADDAYFRNIALVTAANNMPIPSYPSVYSSVISVASHAVQDPYVFYYNPNPPVEFGALGIDVDLAWLDHKRRTMTGNSYASPHMAGLVAKILGKHPGLTMFQLKTILRELSANVDRNRVTEHPRLLGEQRSREENPAENAPPLDARPPG
ncbi:S8 family serine peptidase [Mycolicibacterium sp. BiH015]|uniref:S8 family serine peptidase n=1 Tax=Mycolicibacterium sp. BiH015 TaxID=3018808 RepID=UPI0022E67390|nr:S8 family serine peptidase [Mycolicibacterium sp. BiH015]